MNQRFAGGGHDPSHNRQAKLFISEGPLLDRCESDLHHTLEPDVDALLEHRSSAKAPNSYRAWCGPGLGA